MQANNFCEANFGHFAVRNGSANPANGVLDHRHSENTLRRIAQYQKHITVGYGDVMSMAMTVTADSRREALRRLMLERGLRPKQWSVRAGVNVNSIYNYLNGHSKSLEHETYFRLATAEQLPIWRLTGERPELPSPTSVWVSGEAQAGTWRVFVEWDQSMWYAVDVPVPTRLRTSARAMQVGGRSMDLVYQPGDVVLWAACYDFRAPKNLDRVVVYRTRTDGMIEATIKEYREDATGRWLWPRSSDPTFQEPINLDQRLNDITSIEIVGIIVGSYRAEAF